MSRGRIRLNVGGGATKLGGAGAVKGLKLRKVKKERVKAVRTEAEAEAPRAEREETVYTKQATGKVSTAPRTADKGGDVSAGAAKPTLKPTSSKLKSLRPGTGWR